MFCKQVLFYHLPLVEFLGLSYSFARSIPWERLTRISKLRVLFLFCLCVPRLTAPVGQVCSRVRTLIRPVFDRQAVVGHVTQIEPMYTDF